MDGGERGERILCPELWCPCGEHMVVGGYATGRCPICQDEWERAYRARQGQAGRKVPDRDVTITLDNICRGQE